MPWQYFWEVGRYYTSDDTDYSKTIVLTENKGQNVLNQPSSFTIDLFWNVCALESECRLIDGEWECGAWDQNLYDTSIDPGDRIIVGPETTPVSRF
jgi:hypothetical protein